MQRFFRRLFSMGAPPSLEPQRRRGRMLLGVETLEDRTLLAANPLLLPTITFTVSAGDVTGQIEMETLPHLAPVTVDNFSNYIDDGDFLTSIFHRLDKTPGQQVIQGGQLTSATPEFTSAAQFGFVPSDASIVNESDAALRPNVRGAVGMARTSAPNSATSQFYFNVEDNPGFDQPLNPFGFAVFANITDMTTVDLIATLDVLPEAPLGLTTVPFADTADGDRDLVRIEEVAATGTIHGVKFNDRDGDGVREAGEEGIAGVTMIVDVNGNLSIDDDDPTTVTDAEGRYAFKLELDDAAAQDFSVGELLDDTMVPISPSGGIQTVTVRPGLDTDGVDFGNQILPVVEIEAVDPSAAEEGQDPGRFRVFISNTDVATVPLAMQVLLDVGGTADEGPDYSLPASSVVLSRSQTSLTVDMTPRDDLEVESDESVVIRVTPVSGSYGVGASDTATMIIADNDSEGGSDGDDGGGDDGDGGSGDGGSGDGGDDGSGGDGTSSLAGTVFLDIDADTTVSSGDRPVGGITVRLDATDGTRRTVVTAADGSYRFDNLPADGYTLTEDPVGELRTFLRDGGDTVGTQGGTVNSATDQVNIPALAEGVAGSGNNFGELGRRAGFVGKRDFLSTTPPVDLLAAVDVESGDTLWFSLGEAWQGFTGVTVSLSNNLRQLTLTVTDGAGTTQSATVDTRDRRPARFLGNLENAFLISIAGGPADLGLSPPAGSSAISTLPSPVDSVAGGIEAEPGE